MIHEQMQLLNTTNIYPLFMHHEHNKIMNTSPVVFDVDVYILLFFAQSCSNDSSSPVPSLTEIITAFKRRPREAAIAANTLVSRPPEKRIHRQN